MKLTIFTSLILWLISTPLCLAGENNQHPNFTGNWTLNTKMSDDIQQVMMKAMGAGGGRGGGGGGRGGSMGGGKGGGRGGGRRGGMGGNQPGQNPKAMKRAEEMKQQHSRLEIFQDGIELNVTNGLDISRLLHTDGRTENIWTQRGEATATANWENQVLMVQWKSRQETLSRTRSYQLIDDGRRLTVKELIRVPNSNEMISVRLVYDLQK